MFIVEPGSLWFPKMFPPDVTIYTSTKPKLNIMFRMYHEPGSLWSPKMFPPDVDKYTGHEKILYDSGFMLLCTLHHTEDPIALVFNLQNAHFFK